jgi:hypothetical protein
MTIRRTLLTIAALLAVPAAAWAQSANRGPHDVVVARLAEGYGESRQSIALGANNSVVEVFASSDSGSWTTTVTAPGADLSCRLRSGLSGGQ